MIMKTFEEINEIAPYHPCEWQQGYGIWQAGYMEGQKNGASEQKEIDDADSGKELLYVVNKTTERVKREMIDKACEWLKAYCGMNESGLGQFRNAMGK